VLETGLRQRANEDPPYRVQGRTMPVSTFSSANAALRGHNGMIARWSSTRDRLREDERRMSHGGINEMDGTGLYERPNWPLADIGGGERNVSPETPEDEEDSRRRREALENVVQDAVVRRSEDIGGGMEFIEHDDVSDLDEDEERDFEDVEKGLERDAYSGAENQEVTPPSDEGPDIPMGRSDPRETAIYSPLGMAPQMPQDPEGGDLSHGLQQAETIPEYIHSSSSEEEELHHSNGYFAGRTSNGHHAASSSRSRSLATVVDDEDEEADEAYGRRDAQMEETVHSAYTPSTPQTNDATPHMNGNATPQTNGHGRASSMMKGTPPSRSNSRLSNYQTTHIPSNKERVRYSWQSFQDDEPNRPRIHIIKLVSEVATASAGFPGGEAFGFSISQGGRRIAAYNSARLYVLQTAALPVGISQDYALKRRPLAVEIVDEGDVMAILADEHTVNVYDLGHQRLRRTRTIKLDFPSNCIALASTGGLLAAAYEGGVEIFSLDPSALPTDRRAVRSQRMDRLFFSEDGSTLLGTTTRINVSSTVVVSVPVFPSAPNGIPTHEELKEAWCSELLHPENIRNSSHATFMRENQQSCNDRVLAWNGLADTFGILNIADLQYGNIDFPVVISPPLSTCGGLGAAIHSCPAIDEHGDTVAMIVNDRTIRLYIVPHKAEDDETTVEAHSIDHELDEGYGCPFNEVRWVYSSASLPAPLDNQTQVHGRLIVTSPGGVVEQGMSEEYVDDIEGGRIILFDFDPQFAGQPGQTFSLTLGKSPPQMLEEEEADVASQVALVRRRTVNQSKSGGLSHRPVTLGRAATTFNRERTLRSASPSFAPNAHRRSMLSIHSFQSEATRSLPDLVETNETGEAFEEPYAQNAPRSQVSLQRAASNAQRHRFQMLEERNQERISVDSSGNFLPLPEYTEEPNAPLPSRFRAMAGLDAPPPPPPKPSIMTSVNGNGSTGPSTGSSGPATASTATAETFKADQAFRTARGTLAQQRQDSVAAAAAVQSPVSPTSGTNTFSPTGTMPRSLQRAYSNAVSPLGSGPAPSLIGDSDNVGPVGQNGTASLRGGALVNGALHSPSSATLTSTVPEDESWDVISPVAAQPSSPFSRAQQASNPYRHSTSLLNPPGHSPLPARAPSSASSYGTMTSIARSPSSAGGRRWPPHMQAFRNAAAASGSSSASPSLFPSSQAPDHVPFRAPPAKAGSVAHPITAWHPPAPSSVSLPPPNSARGHSRKSSLTSRSAFAPTARAKKLGFFKKKRPFIPGGYPSEDGDASMSMMETRSMMTWATRGEGKCVVM
jgi:hypothetical protein